MRHVIVVALNAERLLATFHLAIRTDRRSTVSAPGDSKLSTRQALIRPRCILNCAIPKLIFNLHILAPFPRKPGTGLSELLLQGPISAFIGTFRIGAKYEDVPFAEDLGCGTC